MRLESPEPEKTAPASLDSKLRGQRGFLLGSNRIMLSGHSIYHFSTQGEILYGAREKTYGVLLVL